ncbi:MAG TPA: trypsin-like peptidase domain-containing protein [Dehalococcoidales bacterium]|nr:trypsin-like peptidase domain-containing protein [Dehalococcoidales bacterium]
MRYRLLIISVLITVFIALAGCSAQKTTTSTVTASGTTTSASTATTTSTSVVTTVVSSPDAVANIETTLESIFNRVNPSVVLIQVNIPPSVASPGGAALGSGFVWDTQGNIVTNDHVVNGATGITVTLYDGTTVNATMVGEDADSDLAVIKVDTNGLQLQPVTLADSTTVKVGQWAIAIGNPYGLENTLTAGFVSGIGRLVPANSNAIGPTYSIPDIIQTDAAINPGNSGGVLLDKTGAVIGVTQSIESASGSSSGVGFAIPSAIVQQVVPALITGGHYDHPYLGISVASVTPDIAGAMNLPASQRGALVIAVSSGGPADKAGIKAGNQSLTVGGNQINVGGDIIIAFNGQIVKSSDNLISDLAAGEKVGQNATLTVLRGGQQIQVQVTIGARPGTG